MLVVIAVVVCIAILLTILGLVAATHARLYDWEEPAFEEDYTIFKPTGTTVDHPKVSTAGYAVTLPKRGDSAKTQKRGGNGRFAR